MSEEDASYRVLDLVVEGAAYRLIGSAKMHGQLEVISIPLNMASEGLGVPLLATKEELLAEAAEDWNGDRIQTPHSGIEQQLARTVAVAKSRTSFVADANGTVEPAAGTDD